MKRKVAVLMGGKSAERAVSLSTGQQILRALDPARYEVYALDTTAGQASLPVGTAVQTLTIEGTNAPVTALTQLGQVAHADRPDVVFIALHGPGGEDGTVQGMLEVLGIPYTGSGVLASALAMDKVMSKRVLASTGVRMPCDVTVTRGEEAQAQAALERMPLPVIVKPSRQGSTIGMSVVRVRGEMPGALQMAFVHDSMALVEEFVAGTEITVPVLGNKTLETLPVVEIVPQSGFYDYEAKYTAGATDEIVPARISPGAARQAREIALLCHRTLGCRGMSRTDMIVDAHDHVYVLEVNTIPGMTPTSLLPRSAQAAGLPFSALLDRLVDLALEP